MNETPDENPVEDALTIRMIAEMLKADLLAKASADAEGGNVSSAINPDSASSLFGDRSSVTQQETGERTDSTSALFTEVEGKQPAIFGDKTKLGSIEEALGLATETQVSTPGTASVASPVVSEKTPDAGEVVAPVTRPGDPPTISSILTYGQQQAATPEATPIAKTDRLTKSEEEPPAVAHEKRESSPERISALDWKKN